MSLILVLIGTILIVLFTFSILYFKFGWLKWFYHDLLNWHQPNNKQGFNGSSFTSECKYCGKHIMQDSQGNWF